ncbi:hypothetical protein NOR_02754 [Metarhizium rileyi]|uniref:Uncharacterized protein n=1 Tax=Metarhizium rileyi (strain RCEF 4871) TaxID=1649241 RepID=A0A162JPC6_METRR|nr:hypothetical protein NOR_02754 [Metarhizium rileyi RCEF 4871]TWU71486.1 hypothetical protein ED733_000972 [Metarhizium rileyi]
MQPSKIILAALPALALAESSGASNPTATVTMTDTTTVVKTITLSRAHTASSSWSANSTMTTFKPTGGISSFTTPAVVTTAPVPTTKGPENAAGFLDATNVAFAGVAGMIVMALM